MGKKITLSVISSFFLKLYEMQCVKIVLHYVCSQNWLGITCDNDNDNDLFILKIEDS